MSRLYPSQNPLLAPLMAKIKSCMCKFFCLMACPFWRTCRQPSLCIAFETLIRAENSQKISAAVEKLNIQISDGHVTLRDLLRLMSSRPSLSGPTGVSLPEALKIKQVLPHLSDGVRKQMFSLGQKIETVVQEQQFALFLELEGAGVRPKEVETFNTLLSRNRLYPPDSVAAQVDCARCNSPVVEGITGGVHHQVVGQQFSPDQPWLNRTCRALGRPCWLAPRIRQAIPMPSSWRPSRIPRRKFRKWKRTDPILVKHPVIAGRHLNYNITINGIPIAVVRGGVATDL